MSTLSKDREGTSKNEEEKVCAHCNAIFYDTDPDLEADLASAHSEDYENYSIQEDQLGEEEEESSMILEKPARYRTAYMIFTKFSWSQYRDSHPEEHFSSAIFKQMSPTFAAQWKKMSEEEKKPYRTASAAEKANYEERMVAYKAQQMQLKKGRGSTGSFSKRPLTSYMLFAVEEREKVLQAMGGKGGKAVEVATELGRRWAALPEEVKEAYKAKAREAREKYDAALKEEEGVAASTVEGTDKDAAKEGKEGQKNLENENSQVSITTEQFTESDVESDDAEVKSICSSGYSFRRLRRGSFSPAYSFSYGESFGEDEEEDYDVEDDH